MTMVKPNPSRGGRPRRELAGDVDRRLLEAALHLFMERGFEGTSCKEVAGLAGAGKASLYARFANKEALFTAAIRHQIGSPLQSTADVDPHLCLEERLRRVGLAILQHALLPRTLAVMRLVVATATRFPDLAAHANQLGWEGGIERVKGAILAGSDQPVEPAHVAEQFVNLVFAPHQLRALLGEDRERLVAAAPGRVEGAIRLLRMAGAIE